MPKGPPGKLPICNAHTHALTHSHAACSRQTPENSFLDSVRRFFRFRHGRLTFSTQRKSQLPLRPPFLPSKCTPRMYSKSTHTDTHTNSRPSLSGGALPRRAHTRTFSPPRVFFGSAKVLNRLPDSASSWPRPVQTPVASARGHPGGHFYALFNRPRTHFGRTFALFVSGQTEKSCM